MTTPTCPQCHGPLTAGFSVFGILVSRCQLTGTPIVRQAPAVPIA